MIIVVIVILVILMGFAAYKINKYNDKIIKEIFGDRYDNE